MPNKKEETDFQIVKRKPNKPEYTIESEIGKKGLIRIGRIRNSKTKIIKGYKNILVNTPDAGYGEICLGSIKRKVKVKINNNEFEQERCLLNEVEFSKVYPDVPEQKKRTAKGGINKWIHPKEVHIDKNDEPTPEYYQWREKGITYDSAIKYPATRQSLIRTPRYVMPDLETKEHMSFNEAARRYFIKIYDECIRETKTFKKLQTLLEKGENLILLDTEGPEEQIMPYYIDKYNVKDNFIIYDSMLATPENLGIMCYDDKYNFSFTYWIAMSLLNLKPEDLPSPQGLKFQNSNWDRLFG